MRQRELPRKVPHNFGYWHSHHVITVPLDPLFPGGEKKPAVANYLVDGCENPDKSGGGCRVAAEASEPAGLLAGGAVCRSINCRCISSII